MKKRCMDMCMGLMMLFLVSLLCTEVFSTQQVTSMPSDNIAEVLIPALSSAKTPVVVIDSGHGGDDPGKVGINNALEKDINLSIACKLRDKLTGAGIQVVMTRETDTGLYKNTDKNKKVADLRERCRIIEESNADFAISIHQNSYHTEDVYGPQMFYYQGSEEGEKLALSLQNAFSAVCSKVRPTKANDNYFLLLHVSCPVVIAECGFLSNWNEAELLVTYEYQDQVAEALYNGIIAHLGYTPTSTAESITISFTPTLQS